VLVSISQRQLIDKIVPSVKQRVLTNPLVNTRPAVAAALWLSSDAAFQIMTRLYLIEAWS